MFFFAPIPQDTGYHTFSDQETYWNIPNFWNVVSNLPFVLIGVWGLWNASKHRAPKSVVLFYVGIIVVGPGSAYYHWNPKSNTLIWDRLPMTIAFMSFFIWILSVFVSSKIEKWLLPAMLYGAGTVVYWAYYDDLRFYAWVQFAPILVVVVLLIFYSSEEKIKLYMLGVIGAYVCAKLCEHYDEQIFNLTHRMMSGHAIKHVFSAIAPLFPVYYFIKKDHSGPISGT